MQRPPSGRVLKVRKGKRRCKVREKACLGWNVGLFRSEGELHSWMRVEQRRYSSHSQISPLFFWRTAASEKVRNRDKRTSESNR